jgi:PAS domain S-box-containing protein
MPVMDGLQLLNELRSESKTQLIPIIMLSARAGEESRVEGMQAGADDYLVKPFTARELIARVEAHIKMSRVRREFYEQRSDLQRQLQQAADAIENLSDGFLTFDKDWRLSYINPAGERITRRGREELLGRSLWELFPDLVGSKLEDEYRRAVREQMPVEFEWLYEPYKRWFKNRIYPTPDGGAAVYCRDTTEVRKAEDALRKAEQLAAVGRLAASISHELNNPLEAVTNLLFLAKSADINEARRLLELADKEVRRLSHIASRSLKFYRQSTSPSPTQLREIMDSVLFFYEPRLRSKNIHVERRYDIVPDVVCLTGEMQQVFANLISNSLEAIESDGKLILSIANAPGPSDSHGAHVRVTVADTGSGMDEHTKQHLFEPFYTTKGELGTGLGLWVSREILEKHQASVKLRSKPGRGTVFSLVFPTNGLSAAKKAA